jgi:hypothetical protein
MRARVANGSFEWNGEPHSPRLCFYFFRLEHEGQTLSHPLCLLTKRHAVVMLEPFDFFTQL